jgi:hypothetical protein
MQAAVDMLKSMLTKASGAAGITKLSSPNDGSISSAIREQLQQSGMLQSLAAIMTAMAADLQAGAAALAAGGSLAADVDLGGRVHKLFENINWLHWQLADLWGCHGEPPSDRIGSWLCDPSSHVLAAIQLTSAYLQYASAVVQHVLPAVQERAPQEAEQLLSGLSAPFSGMMLIFRIDQQCGVLTARDFLPGGARAAECSNLLRSPGMLQYASTLLLVHAFEIRQAVSADCHTLVPAGGSSSSGGDSSSSGAAADYFTACQLQLLQLLGLAPQVIAWLAAPCSLDDASSNMFAPLSVCSACNQARLELMAGLCCEAGLVVDQQQRRRVQFEHQLWQLLPLVLLPCARALLSSNPEGSILAGLAMCASQYIQISESHLQLCGDNYRFEELDLAVAFKHGAWVQEMLAELLQLANLVLSAVTSTCRDSSSHPKLHQQQHNQPHQSGSGTGGHAGANCSTAVRCSAHESAPKAASATMVRMAALLPLQLQQQPQCLL